MQTIFLNKRCSRLAIPFLYLNSIAARLGYTSLSLYMFDASSAADDSTVEPQKLISEPVRIIQKYPSGEGGDSKKKTAVCFSWVLSDQPLHSETQIIITALN